MEDLETKNEQLKCFENILKKTKNTHFNWTHTRSSKSTIMMCA